MVNMVMRTSVYETRRITHVCFFFAFLGLNECYDDLTTTMTNMCLMTRVANNGHHSRYTSILLKCEGSLPYSDWRVLQLRSTSPLQPPLGCPRAQLRKSAL
jgi:hypothetical protein